MENDIESLRFLTLRQTAEALHVSVRTVSRMLRRKELPAIRVGGQWRVRESELTKFIQGLEER